MKRNLTLVFALFILSVSISAQTLVKGIVKEIQGDKEVPLPFANVYIEGTTLGTTTNFDGYYEIKLEPGTYTISFSFIGYEKVSKEITADGETPIEINVTLKAGEGQKLQEVEVAGKANRESENMLMLEQKKAVIAVEAIGAKEMSRKAVSDVAAGVKKVTGVSMMGSKQLFVRGLGDRYNSAELNGLPITSPDPAKKVVKLDMFQADIVKLLEVSKVFNAKNYADYTGALINIETKDYPTEPFLSVSIGGKYNSNSTGKPFYMINSAGNKFFGFDVNARRSLTPKNYLVVNRIMNIGEDFHPASFGFTTNNASPNSSFSINGGKLFDLNGSSKIGVLASVSFDNEYEYSPNVIDLNISNKQGNIDGNYVSQIYSYNTYFTSLLSLSFLNGDRNNITYNMVYLNNGENGFKQKKGLSPDWGEEDTALIRNAEYIKYRLLSNQLRGKHKLNDKLSFNWNGSLMNVMYDIPDRREIVYQQNPDLQWTYFALNNGNDTKRVIIQQNAIEYNGTASLDYALNDDKGNVSVGAYYRSKYQTYNSYMFGYLFNQSNLENYAVDISNPDAYFGPQIFDRVKSNTNDGMGYDGNLNIYSGFVDFVYNLNRLTINAGLRTEYSGMEIISNTNRINNNETSYSFSNLDLFPVLNLKYSVNDKSNVRFAVSRTVTRPSFYEKSPAQMIPELGERLTVGNPGTKANPAAYGYLENSYSNNIDVKYEIFPKQNELISISAYYKQIIEPIEQKLASTGGTDFIKTFVSTPENATAAGAEIELKKRFNNIFAGLNAAYIYTNIKVPASFDELTKERPLQGASPYIINADLGYNLRYGKGKTNVTYFGFVFNSFGERLYAVASDGIGNQYELPFNALDFVLKNSINQKLEISFNVKNILNSTVQYKQDIYSDLSNPNVKTGQILVYEYKKGITASLGISYKF
ncbi:carboxypeptidase-like regulatory domain-containing protein [Saccharicrinis sp. FJH62]|uniref:TonB-dependent receptor n=1 Tax=Saccharicrinis sp. FJH62 TaxID=3344657 RepID=UPI0035D48998